MSMPDRLRPKDLILGLLFASRSGQLEVGALIRAGLLFQIQSNSIRVTLARLQSEGLIDSPQRGQYQLGSRARALGDEAARWKQAAKRIRKWNGHYRIAATAHLPRNDRLRIQTREKALTLGGFRQLRDGLWLRPDNLDGSVESMRARLCALGLDPTTILLSGTDFSQNISPEIADLWDVEGLNESYTMHTRNLNGWLENHQSLPLEQAARESWILGAAAIRRIVYDPLLPSEWVEETNRYRFFKTVKAMDDAGQAIWSAFLQET